MTIFAAQEPGAKMLYFLNSTFFEALKDWRINKARTCPWWGGGVELKTKS